ncbi:20578_t:CDS:2 [Rhizophagus irregularis]|nr:20578_t:CDS:2 [Rhizophagus irregularis]
MKWQSVLGWFPTEESRSDEEAKQFEEADDEKSKEDRRYRAGMYNPTPKSQEPSAEVDQDCRELPEFKLSSKTSIIVSSKEEEFYGASGQKNRFKVLRMEQ